MADVIQSLWVGERLSRIEILSIRSFLAQGHPFHLYTYGPVEGVPEGTTVKDANLILDQKQIFRINGSLAIFADWFRQELLYACGGYWADLDLICLRPLDFDDDIVVGKQEPARVSNAIMRFPKGHPVTRQLADVSRDPNMILEFDNARDRRRKWVRRYLTGNRRASIPWGESSGPAGLTKALKHHGLLKQAKPFYYFYPLNFQFWYCAFDDTFSGGAAFFDQSYCVHLWNERIRKFSGVNKEGPFRKDSLIDQLMRRYAC